MDWIEELVDASDRTTGLTRLEHAVANFNQHLLTRPLRDEDIRDMLSKPIHRTLFKRAIRYESSEWGSHDDAGLDELVARYFSYKADGRLAPLSPEIVGVQSHRTSAPDQRYVTEKISLKPTKRTFLRLHRWNLTLQARRVCTKNSRKLYTTKYFPLLKKHLRDYAMKKRTHSDSSSLKSQLK